MTAADKACGACIRRASLLGALSPLIERIATGGPRSGGRELLALPDDALMRTLAPGGSPGLGAARSRILGEDRLRARLDALGLWSTCRHRADYPAGLANLEAQAPAALFGRGDRTLHSSLEGVGNVAIVGARRATAYGRASAAELGRQLAGCGVTVISGLANGIDSCAHEGALDGGGMTVAVLGAGADRAYPPGQARLYERIVADGLVISELPPGSRPFRWTFPARNRIMAALAELTVVVEAAERSGSLITAEMTLDLGRELGAVPGPINSAAHDGANRLLFEGARVIRGAQDVLDVVYGPGAREVVEHGAELSPVAELILSGVERRESPDAIAATLSASPAEVASELSELELLGYITCDAVGLYMRTSLRRSG